MGTMFAGPVFAWSREAEVGADQTSLLKPWSRLTCTLQHRSHSSTCPGDGRCTKHNHFCHAVCRGKCHSITRSHSRLQAERYPNPPLQHDAIWMLYEETATQLAQRHIAYCTFCHRYLQHVVVAWPMTDLCATCQKNSAAIIRSVNLSEEEKSEVKYTYMYVLRIDADT